MGDELAPEITYHLVNTLGWPSLRPLQKAAVAPLRAGRNALLVAPTAGGKTEAAMFPLLSQMVAASPRAQAMQPEDRAWQGLSVIYVTPLRALLNNLYPRLEKYASWVGRRVGLWHGDVGAGARRRIINDSPDVLLTTPESLEAMLVSTKVAHDYFFAGVRTVVVDELHAFAGDDRGWHLLAVLERLERLAGGAGSAGSVGLAVSVGATGSVGLAVPAGRLQRIGMTATVGNPRELLAWLTRSADLADVDAGVVVAPELKVSVGMSTGSASPSGAVSAAHNDVAAGATADEPTDRENGRQGDSLPSADDTADASTRSTGAAAGVCAPATDVTAGADIVVDFVANTDNAAKIIDLLHPGEKRLVFCQSRAQAETLAAALRARGVTTVVSHSSLSADERRRAEQTFAEAATCVVVATSTLELGVDIGDLDRVIQIDAPNSVASFLQRLGRTGRRPGARRNMTFLAVSDSGLLASVALLHLWASGFVEPVVPPPTPQHIAAQQLLALGLQEGRYSLAEWRDWWPGLTWMQEARPILEHLLSTGYLGFDAGFATVGDAAEQTFGRRNFLELTSVFTAAPELKVLAGRTEVGAVSPLAVTGRVPGGGATVLSLGGRSWRVTHVDWRRRQVYVVADEGRGRSVWQGGPTVLSAQMAQATREVLLGAQPAVTMSQRAVARLAVVRAEAADVVVAGASTWQRTAQGGRWWTWAGTRANTSLAAALVAQGWEATARGLSVEVATAPGLDPVPGVSPGSGLDPGSGVDPGSGHSPATLGDSGPGAVPAAKHQSGDVAVLRACAALLRGDPPVAPLIDAKALAGLKFAEILPAAVAAAELAARMTDAAAAADVAAGPVHVLDQRG